MEPILRTAKLSKSFLLKGTPRPILRDLDFTMREGTFVSIIGSSGCGKSTFLELLAGITKPDGGEVFYRGGVITGKSGLLGYMPQDDLLFPWLDVEKNVLLPVRARNSDLKSAQARIRELLPVFGLQEHAKHLPYQLSGGLRQRAALLRTCMTETTLLLLDEPFASLDAITRMQLQVWLKDIIQKLKLSIILVTHDIDEAINLSDEIHLMQGSPGKFGRVYDLKPELRADEIQKSQLKQDILTQVGIGYKAAVLSR